MIQWSTDQSVNPESLFIQIGYNIFSILLKCVPNSSIIDNSLRLYQLLLNLTIYFDVKLPNFSFKMPINSLSLLVFAIIPKNSLAPLIPTP